MSPVSNRCPEHYERIFVFRSKIYFFDISISGGSTGESEVSTVLTRLPEKNSTIFVFRSKKFFFNISISGGRTGKREV